MALSDAPSKELFFNTSDSRHISDTLSFDSSWFIKGGERKLCMTGGMHRDGKRLKHASVITHTDCHTVRLLTLLSVVLITAFSFREVW